MTRDSGDGKKVLQFFRRKTDAQRAREYAAVEHRLEQERRTAGPIAQRLLFGTPRERWPALSERPELQTVGALEYLGNKFAEILAREPREAMAIAELAVAAAEAIQPNAYPDLIVAQLRAHAWKDLGKALRFLGRNPEALDAFDTAEERVEPYGSLGHDRAIVRFNRVMSLQELERFDESRALLAECRELFEEFGDTQNMLRCGLAEGILLQRLRQYREAREVYLLLFASAEDMDRETRAALHRAVGLCSIELNDFREAEVNLTRAVSLSETLGQRMESLKSETSLGRLYLRRGETERAVTHLRPVRREFLEHGLTEEAGICGLEIVEGLILLGRASAAEKLARRLVSEFTAAGLNARAIGALGYLTEAIMSSRASATLVTEVREYIVSLRTSPERDFDRPS